MVDLTLHFLNFTQFDRIKIFNGIFVADICEV